MQRWASAWLATGTGKHLSYLRVSLDMWLALLIHPAFCFHVTNMRHHKNMVLPTMFSSAQGVRHKTGTETQKSASMIGSLEATGWPPAGQFVIWRKAVPSYVSLLRSNAVSALGMAEF